LFLARIDSEAALVPNDPPSLQSVLLESVDQGFLAFGEAAREVFYRYINSSCRLRREEVPDHLEIFHQALQGLGAGARVIEKLIAKDLYTKFGLNFTERANWTLVDYVNNVRQELHQMISERQETATGANRVP
jgi:hypothetical protein